MISKKEIIGVVFCLLSVETSIGMSVPPSANRDSTGVPSVPVYRPRSPEQEGEESKANFLKFKALQVNLKQNYLEALVTECVKQDGEITELLGRRKQAFPLERTVVGYMHDFENGFSMPVLKLFATANNLEKDEEIVYDSDWVDEGTKIDHQVREVYPMMDDANLQAQVTRTLFITTETEELEIKKEDERRAYTRVRNRVDETREFKREGDKDYQKVQFVEVWRRPDESELEKKTEGWKQVDLNQIDRTQPIFVIVPVHHWNKPVALRRHATMDLNVRVERIVVQPGERIPRAIILNSDWNGIKEMEY